MGRGNIIGVALGTIAIALSLLMMNNNMSDRQAAAIFYENNKDELRDLVGIAKAAPLPERVETDTRVSPCTDVRCEPVRMLLRHMGSELMLVNDQCNDAGRCSLSILVRRRGLYVSGSGTEIIYDTDPHWGYFVIHRLQDAGPGWYYRHLGD